MPRPELRCNLLTLALLATAAAALVGASPGGAAPPPKPTVCLAGPPACQYGSIQDAVDAAPSGATIGIAAGTYNGPIVIDRSVTLVGAGAKKTTIATIFPLDGSDLFVAGGTVAISGVTLAGGHNNSPGGGDILNEGDGLTLTDSTVTGSVTSYAGAIFNFAPLTIRHSTITGNASPGPGAPPAGIWNTEGVPLVVEDSTITGNDGVGILNEGTLTVSDSTVSRGTPVDENHNQLFLGSGIVNSGTAELVHSFVKDNEDTGIVNYGSLALTGSTVSGNTSTFTVGGIANSGGSLSLEDSTVAGNTSEFGSGGIDSEGGTLSVIDSSIRGNSGTGSGAGGLYVCLCSDDGLPHAATIRNSEVVDNAGAEGGGIFNDRATLTLRNTTVSRNTSSDLGGGISNAFGTLALLTSRVTHNTAATDGGGIFNDLTDTGSVVTVADSEIRHNAPNDCSGC